MAHVRHLFIVLLTAFHRHRTAIVPLKFGGCLKGVRVENNRWSCFRAVPNCRARLGATAPKFSFEIPDQLQFLGWSHKALLWGWSGIDIIFTLPNCRARLGAIAPNFTFEIPDQLQILSWSHVALLWSWSGVEILAPGEEIRSG